MKHILVLIDFRDPMEQVTASTIKLALAFNAHCWLLHVASPDPEFVGYDPGPQYIRDHRADELKKEHLTLEKLQAQFQENALSCDILLVKGSPAEVIRSEIKKRDIDLVVMGHHHRSSIQDWIIGGVGKEVIRNTQVPLFIIPVEPVP